MLHDSKAIAENANDGYLSHRSYIQRIVVSGDFVYDVRYAVGMWR